MPYATKQNIDDRYGAERLLVIADRDGDGAADTAAIDLALADATDEINVYVGAKHDLPLPSVPAVLVRVCVDIAVYRLAASADVLTDEIRQRYEDAIALLKGVSNGTASLGLDDPAPPKGGGASTTSQPRVFTRAQRLF